MDQGSQSKFIGPEIHLVKKMVEYKVILKDWGVSKSRSKRWCKKALPSYPYAD
jgi:hypothetical protein